MKSADVHNLKDDELVAKLIDAKEEAFNLRFRHATGELENTARLGQAKRDIARLITVGYPSEEAEVARKVADVLGVTVEDLSTGDNEWDTFEEPYHFSADGFVIRKHLSYRIAQEALHNIVKHSGASRATVSLSTDGAEAVLSVADDGVGFDAAGVDHKDTLGLVSMRERARLVQGLKDRGHDVAQIDMTSGIQNIGTFEPQSNDTVIDASGLVLAPGFIDIHNHSDDEIGKQPLAQSQIAQGITSMVLGPDGYSPYPVGPWLDERRRDPAAERPGCCWRSAPCLCCARWAPVSPAAT